MDEESLGWAAKPAMQLPLLTRQFAPKGICVAHVWHCTEKRECWRASPVHLKLERKTGEAKRGDEALRRGKVLYNWQDILAVPATQSPVMGCFPWLSKSGLLEDGWVGGAQATQAQGNKCDMGCSTQDWFWATAGCSPRIDQLLPHALVWHSSGVQVHF